MEIGQYNYIIHSDNILNSSIFDAINMYLSLIFIYAFHAALHPLALQHLADLHELSYIDILDFAK